jgi:transcription antitermination factor NusG
MNTTTSHLSVGNQVKVLFGPFRGICGEVVEVHRQAITLRPGEPREPQPERLLVKLDLRGRNVVVDFSPQLVADQHRRD